MSVSCNGWVNSVAFSPSASQICYVTHDCEVNFADVSKNASDPKSKPPTEKIMHNGNPHLGCIFLEEEKLVATGYDKVPYLYVKKGGKWEMSQVLDKGMSNTRKTKIGSNSFKDKKVYFNSDFKLASSVEMKETDTMHVNFINCLKIFAQDTNSSKIKALCTSDVNGFLNYWDVSNI